MEIVKIENGQIEIAKEFTKQYKEFLKLQLEMDLKMKEVKEKVKAAMEEYGITSFDNEDLTINDFEEITYYQSYYYYFPTLYQI